MTSESTEKTQRNDAQPGHLYVVSTPIGNLGDITFRAVQILKTCGLIACEDTRVTKKLLFHLDIKDKYLLSYRDENERIKAPELVERLKAGESIALVCDAGTPTLSDPGFRLVRECRRNDVPVMPIPGPSALLSALSVSGLPTHKFYYVGFLPPKKAARLKFFKKYEQFDSTLVFYESCHRIVKFVEDLMEAVGKERVVCIARELTKLHETVLIGPLESISKRLIGKNLKGEFVVIVATSDFQL